MKLEEAEYSEAIQDEILDLIDRWTNFNGNVGQFVTLIRSQKLFPEWTAKEIYILVRSYEIERQRAANYWGGGRLG